MPRGRRRVGQVAFALIAVFGAQLAFGVAAPTGGAVATNFGFTVVDGSVLQFPSPGLLANASGTGQITVTGHTSPAHGAVSVSADGSLSYTPFVPFSGNDTFTYTITDSVGSTATATVSLGVQPFVTNQTYSTPIGTTLNVASPGLLTGSLGTSVTAVELAGPSHGMLGLNPDGSFSYAPDPGFSGTDTFTFEGLGGLPSAGATATVTVRPAAPPVAVNDSFSVVDGTTLHVAAPGILANDSGSALTVTGHSMPAHGTLTQNPDGSFTYQPTVPFSGQDSFVYTVTDAFGQSASATVDLQVGLTVTNQVYSTPAGTTLTVGAPGLLSGALGSSLTASVVSGPSHGTLHAQSDGSFIYSPASGFSGVDQFSFRASDGSGSSDATATITVVPTAHVDPPVAFDGTVVLPTAPDGNGGTFTLASPTGLGPFHYALGSETAIGSVSVDPSTGIFAYDGPAGFTGVERFTYRVSDVNNLVSAPATVTVVVEAPPAYRLVGADGGVFDFGSAQFEHSCLDIPTPCDHVTGGAPSGDGLGYWLVGSDGGVFTFGSAQFFGSIPALGQHVGDIVAVASSPDGGGYWLVGADGAVYAFGDARYAGSLPGLGVVAGDIVGLAPTADGAGYWLVGADGAVDAFGDARYAGSLPGLGVAVGDVVGLAPTADGSGYWLAAADGGVFAFGDAAYLGNATGFAIQRPIVGIVAGSSGGYWLAAGDGGVFSFTPPFLGSDPGIGFWPAGTFGRPKVLNGAVVGIMLTAPGG